MFKPFYVARATIARLISIAPLVAPNSVVAQGQYEIPIDGDLSCRTGTESKIVNKDGKQVDPSKRLKRKLSKVRKDLNSKEAPRPTKREKKVLKKKRSEIKDDLELTKACKNGSSPFESDRAKPELEKVPGHYTGEYPPEVIEKFADIFSTLDQNGDDATVRAHGDDFGEPFIEAAKAAVEKCDVVAVNKLLEDLAPNNNVVVSLYQNLYDLLEEGEPLLKSLEKTRDDMKREILAAIKEIPKLSSARLEKRTRVFINLMDPSIVLPGAPLIKTTSFLIKMYGIHLAEAPLSENLRDQIQRLVTRLRQMRYFLPKIEDASKALTRNEAA